MLVSSFINFRRSLMNAKCLTAIVRWHRFTGKNTPLKRKDTIA